ncbi:MAG: 6-carboxytetrahydropterin synthase QueD [Acidimicrobiales bacterium]
MSTSVTRAFTFEAAHQLPWHEGKCRHLHGHSYRLEVTVTGPIGDNGIVVDFADIRRAVKAEILDRFDHTYLNDLLPNPTAELIAADCWKRLEAAGLTVGHIRLWETADSWVDIDLTGTS